MKEHLLDLRGLQCPLPVLKTRHFMRKLEEGERVRVRTDDPLASIDIPNFAQETDQDLIEQIPGTGDECEFVLIRKGKL